MNFIRYVHTLFIAQDRKSELVLIEPIACLLVANVDFDLYHKSKLVHIDTVNNKMYASNFEQNIIL